MQRGSVASPSAPVRRLSDFTDISAGRAPCDRVMMPQLLLVLYMRRAQHRAAPTPSMLHRSGNSPLHPSEIFHRPTLAARSSWRGRAPARDMESRIVTDQKHRFRALRKVPELLPARSRRHSEPSGCRWQCLGRIAGCGRRQHAAELRHVEVGVADHRMVQSPGSP